MITRKILFGCLILVFAAMTSLRCMADSSPLILCLGDSLTFGVGGDGTTWPNVLAQLTGGTTINRGRSGWIPRHIKYEFSLEDCTTLTPDQLRTIPPQEFENRIHQPNINALRTFYQAGQSVTVHKADGAATVYTWAPRSTQDGDDVIKPDAVGDASHKPFVGTGRWIRSPGAEPARPPAPDICVIWIGANGMEAGDVSASLHEITAALPISTKVLIIGLANRLTWKTDAKTVGEWGQWITECNDRTRQEFPDRFLDLQAWFTSAGPYAGKGFQTRDWTPSASDQDVVNDQTDKTRGLIPRSVHGVKEVTHFNAAGYTAIAHIIHDTMQGYGWLSK